MIQNESFNDSNKYIEKINKYNKGKKIKYFLGINDESIINNGNEGITNEEAKKLANNMSIGMNIDYQKKFNMDKEYALFLNSAIIKNRQNNLI